VSTSKQQALDDFQLFYEELSATQPISRIKRKRLDA
jgi:hypothetical protein